MRGGGSRTPTHCIDSVFDFGFVFDMSGSGRSKGSKRRPRDYGEAGALVDSAGKAATDVQETVLSTGIAVMNTGLQSVAIGEKAVNHLVTWLLRDRVLRYAYALTGLILWCVYVSHDYESSKLHMVDIDAEGGYALTEKWDWSTKDAITFLVWFVTALHIVYDYHGSLHIPYNKSTNTTDDDGDDEDDGPKTRMGIEKHAQHRWFRTSVLLSVSLAVSEVHSGGAMADNVIFAFVFSFFLCATLMVRELHDRADKPWKSYALFIAMACASLLVVSRAVDLGRREDLPDWALWQTLITLMALASYVVASAMVRHHHKAGANEDESPSNLAISEYVVMLFLSHGVIDAVLFLSTVVCYLCYA